MDCVQTIWSYLTFPFTSFGELHWFFKISVFIALITFIVGTDFLRIVYRFGLRFLPFIRINLDDDEDHDMFAEIILENIVGFVLLITCFYTIPLLCAFLVGVWVKKNALLIADIIGHFFSQLVSSIRQRRFGRFCAEVWKLGDERTLELGDEKK